MQALERCKKEHREWAGDIRFGECAKSVGVQVSVPSSTEIAVTGEQNSQLAPIPPIVAGEQRSLVLE